MDDRKIVYVVRDREPSFNPGVAGVLSFLIPGLGQIYKGQLFNGLAWFVCVLLGYCLIIPGIILHIMCVMGAMKQK